MQNTKRDGKGRVRRVCTLTNARKATPELFFCQTHLIYFTHLIVELLLPQLCAVQLCLGGEREQNMIMLELSFYSVFKYQKQISIYNHQTKVGPH